MTNHIHLVANVTEGSLGDVLGHFKTYTSKEIFKMIANNNQESRRDWMINAFEKAGKYNPLIQIINFGRTATILYTFILRQLLSKRLITYTKIRLGLAL